MKRVLFIIISAMTLHSVKAQTVIEGCVMDSVGTPIESAILTLMSKKDSSIISFGFSNMEGRYTLNFKNEEPDFNMRLTGFNIKTEYRTVENKSQSVDWRITEENIMLREVQIKANKIWGKDTLNYLITSFMRDHDSSIGDALKRMPGITIEDDGKIKYNGVSISKFYIENMDLLQGRYNMAVNNLKATDIQTVQVMENHQHVKALQDQELPEAAAINLKLKKEKKGVWTRRLNLGLGWDNDLLRNNDANLWFFGKKQQRVFFYGNNNVGKSSDLLTSHYGGSGISPATMTSMVMPDLSPVGNSNYNDLHQMMTNNLEKLSETSELHYDLTYSHDIQPRNNFCQTNYLMPDGSTQILVENASARMTNNSLNINLTYEDNREMMFLKNSLQLTGIWNSGHGNTVSDKNISQQSFNRTLGMSDAIEYIHRTDGGGGFKLSSNITLQTTPQSITVSPGIYEDILNNGNTFEKARQYLKVNNFSTNNNLSLLKSIRRHAFTIVPTISLNATHANIHSALSADGLVPSSNFEGTMDYTKLTGSLGLTMRYTKNDFNLSLRTPVTSSLTFLGNRSGTDENDRDRFHLDVNPSFDMTWKISDYWSVFSNGSYATSETSWTNLYGTYVLNNYRNISRHDADIYDEERLGARMKINYKDIFNGFLAYVEMSASRSNRKVIYSTTFDKNSLATVTMLYAPNHSNSQGITANLHKDFDWKEMSIDLTGSLQWNNGQYMRQSELVNHHTKGHSFGGTFRCSPAGWLDLDVSGNYSSSQHGTSDGLSQRGIHNFTGTCNIKFTILKEKLFLGMAANHSYNNCRQGQKDYTFFKADATYSVNNNLRFTLEADNLLNTRKYVSFFNSDMTEHYSVYHIRPRSIMLRAAIGI